MKTVLTFIGIILVTVIVSFVAWLLLKPLEIKQDSKPYEYVSETVIEVNEVDQSEDSYQIWCLENPKECKG